jgi:hypothetical protein
VGGETLREAAVKDEEEDEEEDDEEEEADAECSV